MLNFLFKPDSIAVFGASRDPKKVGHAVLNNLIKFNFKGGLYPINPAGEEILGLKACPKISDVGRHIDLAVIAIPARLVPQAIADSSSMGVKAVIVISAGFKETGPEGIGLENEIKAVGKRHNIRILGPNCLGLINTSNSMNATFAGGMLPQGKTAFFSQSGALGIAILDWAIGNKIGFSKFISLGNKADLNETDLIEYLADDPETDVILGYIEDIVEGRRFLDIAKRVTKKKPIILLKAGGTQAGARASASHTGALAGSENAFNAAFKQTGVIRADGIQDLFDTALAFLMQKLPDGDRLLIVTNAGGPGIIAADMAERLKLNLPLMSKPTIDSIRGSLPPNASLYNPVDIIGDATSERYAAVLNKAVYDPNIDGMVVILTPQAMTDVEKTADAVINASKKTDMPIITSFMGEMRVRESIERLRANSICNFSYPETAIKVFKQLSAYSIWKNLPNEEVKSYSSNKDNAKNIINGLLSAGKTQVGEDEAMTILSHYGFVFPKRALAKTAKEASILSAKIGFPVVMKISSADILHKTEVGGVKVGIGSKAQAEDAFIEITTSARRLLPQAFINGVMVYEMIKPSKEVILGVTYDRTFGHMIMFGMGGIYVEVFKDVSFRIVPVLRRDASSMINEIKGVNLLKGVRGEMSVNMDLIIDGILRLSGIAADFPEIEELDINPLVLMEERAVALDARIIFRGQRPPEGGNR